MKIITRVIRRIYIQIRNLYYRFFVKSIKIGKKLNYRSHFRITYEKNAIVELGNNVFFNNDCSINAHEKVIIGNNCIFGENVRIYDHNHVFNIDNVPIYKQGFRCKEVIIGDNCWIGSNVVILPGTLIGNNTVIGAGAVIQGRIANDCILVQERKYQIEAIRYRSNGDEQDG